MGIYGKIKHAAALVSLVDPDKVRGRCPHCERHAGPKCQYRSII